MEEQKVTGSEQKEKEQKEIKGKVVRLPCCFFTFYSICLWLEQWH